MIDRRSLIGGAVGAAVCAPPASVAQPARKVYRVGNFSLGTPDSVLGPQPRSASAAALLRGMRAKALGITVPQALLLRVDEVIQ